MCIGVHAIVDFWDQSANAEKSQDLMGYKRLVSVASEFAVLWKCGAFWSIIWSKAKALNIV